MIVTEEQAKKIECVERMMSPDSFNCLGSKCMGWRWWKGDKRYGYCGLAGVPANTIEPEAELPKEEKKE